MSANPKPRKAGNSGSSLVLAILVFLAMFLLFLRMVAFVTSNGHHRF